MVVSMRGSDGQQSPSISHSSNGKVVGGAITDATRVHLVGWCEVPATERK